MIMTSDPGNNIVEYDVTSVSLADYLIPETNDTNQIKFQEQ